MKVNLERSFPLPVPAEPAWELLQDIERVAGCMPGARITERVDDRYYKGTMAVRLGPANLSFRGEIAIDTIDPASRTLRLTGKGTDATGGSGASLDLTARVDTVDTASCTLVGRSEVSLSGKVVAFGARLADAVAEQVLKQFAANLAAELQAQQASAAVAGTVAGGEAAAAAPPRSTPLNALALLRDIVLGWLRSLFRVRRA